MITDRVLYWSICWTIPFNFLKQITELITVNRFLCKSLTAMFDIRNCKQPSFIFSLQGPGSNRHTTGITTGPSIKDTIWMKLGDNESFYEPRNLMKVPGLHGLNWTAWTGAWDCTGQPMSCTSRRTWAFRVCIWPYSIEIFNFFHGSLAKAGPKLCSFVNFWCFDIFWFPIVRPKV